MGGGERAGEGVVEGRGKGREAQGSVPVSHRRGNTKNTGHSLTFTKEAVAAYAAGEQEERRQKQSSAGAGGAAASSMAAGSLMEGNEMDELDFPGNSTAAFGPGSSSAVAGLRPLPSVEVSETLAKFAARRPVSADALWGAGATLGGLRYPQVSPESVFMIFSGRWKDLLQLAFRDKPEAILELLPQFAKFLQDGAAALRSTLFAGKTALFAKTKLESGGCDSSSDTPAAGDSGGGLGTSSGGEDEEEGNCGEAGVLYEETPAYERKGGRHSGASAREPLRRIDHGGVELAVALHHLFTAVEIYVRDAQGPVLEMGKASTWVGGKSFSCFVDEKLVRTQLLPCQYHRGGGDTESCGPANNRRVVVCGRANNRRTVVADCP